MSSATWPTSSASHAVTAFLTAKMLVLLVNLFRFPVLSSVDGRDLRTVSVLVPARDEAARLPETLPAILAQGAGEVLVLDDGSTDDTAKLAQDDIDRSGHPQARVLTGASLPPGWTGKTWACDQLAAAATGDILVFLDADVMLAQGALAAVLAQKDQQGADVLSVFPRQVTRSVGEHLVVPVIDDVLLCLLAHPLLRLPVPAAATAHGACLVFDRNSYQRVGGFAAVRDRIVDDVAMARRTREVGMRLGLALGGRLVAVRMYRSYQEAVGGLSRGLLPMSGGSRLLLVAGWAAHLLAYTVPATQLRTDRRWAAPFVLGLTERILVEVKTGRRAVWQAVLVPAIAPAVAPLVVRSLRGRPRWRGRTYG